MQVYTLGRRTTIKRVESLKLAGKGSLTFIRRHQTCGRRPIHRSQIPLNIFWIQFPQTIDKQDVQKTSGE